MPERDRAKNASANANANADALPRVCGQYLVYQEIASGGIGRVSLARMQTQGGFARVLAIKTLHPQHAKNAQFATMFLDEARMAARVRHPNVVSILDVGRTDDDGGELFLVMEYIAGESLSRLLTTTRARKGRVDPAIATSIMSGVLEGLHAAHHATNESGIPLQIVHRDVSPQNVLVGVDGVARVLDFGIAKAVGRLQETTQDGQVKGKLAYMAPEQLTKNKTVDHRSDVWSASVLLWEMLTGRLLFQDTAEAIDHHSGQRVIAKPSEHGAPDVLDEVVMRGLARDMDARFQTAREMLVAMDRALTPAPARRVAQWVQKLARDTLQKHATYVKAIEADASKTPIPILTSTPAAGAAPNAKVDTSPRAYAPTQLEEHETNVVRPRNDDDTQTMTATAPLALHQASLAAGPTPASPPRVIGRYAIYGELASGGMATIHYGRLLGPVGFARTVAVKRLHPQYAKDPAFVSMFLEEARLNARIIHPNVVQTLDVVSLANEKDPSDNELFLVMEYVPGTSLAFLVRALFEKQEAKGKQVLLPLAITSAIVCSVLHGLHAAHEATSERGEPLGIVHRDVSPQNVLVSADGIARVLDFGIARSFSFTREGAQSTQDGELKGKLAYMAPEQLMGAGGGESGSGVDRRTDIFAAGVLLWELLTSQRLFGGSSKGETLGSVLACEVEPPSTRVPDLPRDLDAICMRALERDPAERFASAREMATALERCVPVASPTRVAEWVQKLAGAELRRQAAQVLAIERSSELGHVPSEHEPVAVSSARASLQPPPSESRSSRKLQVLIGILLVTTIAVVVVPTVWHPTNNNNNNNTSIVSESAAAPSIGSLAAPPSSSSMEVALSAAVPSTSSSSTALAPSASASHKQGSHHGVRPPPPPAPAGSKPCSVRSYIDNAGITHFIKDCK